MKLQMNEILGFEGDYRFLSNFHPSTVLFEGKLYPSVEHAYAAAKTTNETLREQIRTARTPGAAKRFGRQAVLRDGWDDMRVEVMHNLLIQKFSQDPLMSMLINTGDAYLEETNTWGDKFWGVCEGKGENTLGKLLMVIRADLEVIHSLSEREFNEN